MASALVVGGELNGLGVCRSLALGGVSVAVVDSRRGNPALWSRRARAVVTETLHGAAFVDFLRGYAAKAAEPPFLVVTDELALLTVSENRDEIAGLYRFRLPRHDTVMMLHDKARFHAEAVRRGWPVPDGVVVRDRSDLPAVGALRPPLIVKPADKRHFHLDGAPRLVVAPGHAEAVAAASDMLARVGTALVQETIRGPDGNVYFCLFYRSGRGETVAMFTGRKLASTPPGTGSTAFCAAAEAPELERITEAILDEVDYRGFGGIEYKRDARDGRFLIVEPTVGRTDWQEEIATLAGVNIPLMAYRHEAGLPPLPRPTADPAAVWQVSWIERLRHGSRQIPPGSRVSDGLFRLDDPIPALVHYPSDLAASAARSLSLPWRNRVRGPRADRGWSGSKARI